MSATGLEASQSNPVRRNESPQMPAAQVDIRLLKAFRELVARRAKYRNDQMIESTDPARFAILIRKLFEIAQHRICAYSDHLCRRAVKTVDGVVIPGGEYWSNFEVIEAARCFLDIANTSFEIIVGRKLDVSDGATLGANEFLSGIVESSNRKGVVTVLIAIDGQVGIKSLPDVNFVVADDNGYRMERPGDGTPALTRFGRPTVNNHLFVKFDEMAAEFAAAFQARATNCVKLVYAPDNKNVNSPTHIIGIDSVEPAELERFLIDQIHCPHKPVEMAAQPHTAPSDPK